LGVQNLLLPAELLAGLGAPWNTMQLTGTLKLAAEGLAGKWSSSGGLEDMTGRATLDVLGVATALSTIKPLGSYRLSTTGSVMRLETLADQPTEAALLLSGTGKIEQGRASFLGEASAAAGREEALSNLLHIVGQWQPGVDGRARSILKL
jgi:general secretion pathway protein N